MWIREDFELVSDARIKQIIAKDDGYVVVELPVSVSDAIMWRVWMAINRAFFDGYKAGKNDLQDEFRRLLGV